MEGARRSFPSRWHLRWRPWGQAWPWPCQDSWRPSVGIHYAASYYAIYICVSLPPLPFHCLLLFRSFLTDASATRHTNAGTASVRLRRSLDRPAAPNNPLPTTFSFSFRIEPLPHLKHHRQPAPAPVPAFLPSFLPRSLSRTILQHSLGPHPPSRPPPLSSFQPKPTPLSWPRLAFPIFPAPRPPPTSKSTHTHTKTHSCVGSHISFIKFF